MPSQITINITDEGRTDLDIKVQNGADLMRGFVGLIRGIAQLSNEQTPKEIAEEAVAFFTNEEKQGSV